MKKTKKKTTLSRRQFLTQGSIAFAGITILPRSVFGANERLNIAFVGAGRKGNHAIRSLGGRVNIFAFADVNTQIIEPTLEMYPDVPLYTDFREMLDKHGREIDGVVVSTPDHFHHYSTKYCMEKGIPVYVEKPMCHRIMDCRDLAAAEKEYGVACQMGNQHHSSSNGAYYAREIYKAGLLGEVSEVHCWDTGPTRSQPDEIPTEMAVPDHIHWDTWLGPSPFYHYNNVYFYAGNWRCFNMFGAGGIGDMGPHTFNMAVYMLDLDWPSEIRVVSDKSYRYSYPPEGFEVAYTFPATDQRGPVTLRFFCGDHEPPRPDNLGPEQATVEGRGGSILYGSRNSVITDSHNRRTVIFPEANRRAMIEELRKHTVHLRGNHYGNWLDAIKGEAECRSNFEYGSRLTQIVLLGAIAAQLNRTLKLDPVTRTIVGDEEASNLMMRPPTRNGWNDV